jgi:hypothetical protein
MVNVGAPPEALPIHVFSLFGSRASFAGSGIGGIRETQEMLDFCAEHGIACDVELISGRQDQRGVRARPRLRRPLPLRHRREHDRLTATRAVGSVTDPRDPRFPLLTDGPSPP